MAKKRYPLGIGLTPSTTELGTFIRTRRLELNIQQVVLAEQARVTQNFISLIEIGRRKYLNDQQLMGLAQALRCDQEELRKLMPIKSSPQPKTELGKLIHSKRKELGMTIENFAKKMKMTLKQVKRLEFGKNRFCRYKLLKPLLKVLSLNYAVLSPYVGPTKKETKSELGQLVRTRRKELGLSLEALAKRIYASKQTVNHIESGHVPLNQNDYTIARLAKALNLDVDTLKAVRLKRKLKRINTHNTNKLSEFLVARRLELCLTQREVAESAGISTSSIAFYETGRSLPTERALDKISNALGCEIPIDLRQCLIRGPRIGQKRSKSVTVYLSDQGTADFRRIKELSNIMTNVDIVRKAIKITLLLLEKQNERYVVCLRKEGNIVELEPLF